MKKFIRNMMSPLHSPLLFTMIAFLYWVIIASSITGDLGRVGQHRFASYRTQEKFDFYYSDPVPFSDTIDFTKKRILFIGDSFTGDFYPNSLSSKLGGRCCKYYLKETKVPEEVFVSLVNKGITFPPIIILESVERAFVDRLCNLDFSTAFASLTPESDSSFVKKIKQTTFLTYYKTKLIDNKTVINFQLNKDLFSAKNKENQLFYVSEDNDLPTIEETEVAVKKLDTLYQLAQNNNITLFYVIAADKYDVYQEFVIDNDKAPKTILDAFKEFEQNPYFINTKSILFPLAQKGIKDLYWADDTHWSPIGADYVANEIAKRIDSLQLLN